MSSSDDTSTRLGLFAVGRHAPPDPMPVPAGVRTLNELLDGFAPGVYTAFRTFEHNRFLHLDRHLTRLRQSAQRAGLADALDEQALRAALHAVCTQASGIEHQVRIDVIGRPLDDGAGTQMLIALAPFEPPSERLYTEGVRVRTTRELTRDDPLTKSAAFVARRAALEQRLKSLDDQGGGAMTGPEVHEIIMLDPQDRLLEGLRSNFYAVRAQTLLSPPDGTLQGITQSILLELARQSGITQTLEAVRLSELATLEEAAISASSKGIVPVVQIDELPIGDGRPGPLVTRLVQAYQRYVREHITAAVD
ncbi:MAG: aminotransferase class IV family protein [Gammaproteobacteria bacterium]|nr:aminotransferase class IV family protein [Gammaproteobacteria bacterium]